jgi:hypothetical protein
MQDRRRAVADSAAIASDAACLGTSGPQLPSCRGETAGQGHNRARDGIARHTPRNLPRKRAAESAPISVASIPGDGHRMVTVFERTCRQVGASPASTERKSPGQGAIGAVVGHRLLTASVDYESGGWLVKDVSANASYDLEATKATTEKRVEAKGTTSLGQEVLLRPNEVKHHRQADRRRPRSRGSPSIDRSTSGARRALCGFCASVSHRRLPLRQSLCMRFTLLPTTGGLRCRCTVRFAGQASPSRPQRCSAWPPTSTGTNDARRTADRTVDPIRPNARH